MQQRNDMGPRKAFKITTQGIDNSYLTWVWLSVTIIEVSKTTDISSHLQCHFNHFFSLAKASKNKLHFMCWADFHSKYNQRSIRYPLRSTLHRFSQHMESFYHKPLQSVLNCYYTLTKLIAIIAIEFTW